MQCEEKDFIESLLELWQSRAGRSLAVMGDPRAEGMYWAGVRYKPVKTLFEAVMRCLLAGGFDRIIAFTGQNEQGKSHLPPWDVAEGFPIGVDEMIWIVKGEDALRPAPNQRENAKRTWEARKFNLPLLDNRIIWRAQGSNYWDRLEHYIKRRDDEIKKAEESRIPTALVVDYTFLIPNPREASNLASFQSIQSRQAHTIASSFQARIEGTLVDLILFAEDGLALDLTQQQSSVIARVLAKYMSEYEWKQHGGQLEGILPRLYLGGDIQTVWASRQTTPMRAPRLEVQEEYKTAALYEQIRFSGLNRRSSVPAPPLRPDEVALEFWANIDLAPLRAALDEEMIGQTEAKQVVCSVLQEHKEKCADFLARNGYARKTVEDEWFRLPVMGLFGAAGMGKSSFCKILVRHLFGNEQFGRLIDLAGKNVNVATVGVAPPWAGNDQESDLVSFARQTGGLGVVCFDEFTRILPSSNTRSLADDLGSLLQILQDCKLEPANPTHRPPMRFFYFANTLFVFAANVTQPGEVPPSGFHSIESLGPAFRDRVSRYVFFTPLSPDDYGEAVRRSLKHAAKSWAENNLPRAKDMTSEGMSVEEPLVAYVERAYQSSIEKTGGTPSMRGLNHIVKTLDYGKAFDAAIKRGGRLVLGVDLIREQD